MKHIKESILRAILLCCFSLLFLSLYNKADCFALEMLTAEEKSNSVELEDDIYGNTDKLIRFVVEKDCYVAAKISNYSISYYNAYNIASSIIYRENGTPIEVSEHSYNVKKTMTSNKVYLPKGTYYIKFNPGSYTTGYRVSLLNYDKFYHTKEEALEISLNETFTDNLLNVNSPNWYKVVILQEGSFNFSFNSIESSGDYNYWNAEFYGESGRCLTHKNLPRNGVSTSETVRVYPGTYYLKIQHYENSVSSTVNFLDTKYALYMRYSEEKDISKRLSLEMDMEYSSVEYDGTEKKPAISINGLTEGTDYAVSYSNNINVGKGTITIEGIGSYCGTISKEFSINRMDISRLNGELSYSETTYDNSRKCPEVKIFNPATGSLLEGTDFKATYSNNVNPGTAYVVVEGMGNYTNSRTFDFNILKGDISNKNATLSLSEYQVLSNSTIKVYIDGLVEGTDFSYSFEGCDKIGTGRAIITGEGNYEGTIIKEFKVVPRNISNWGYTLEKNKFEYDGLEKKPSLSLAGLIEDTDYTIEYIDNVNPGKAYVLAHGKGNYSGTLRVEFKIIKDWPEFGWFRIDNKSYWYENDTRQGTENDSKCFYYEGTLRGREIYDPDSDGWYWLDVNADGAKAVGKEVFMPYIYQDEDKWDDEEKVRNSYSSDEGLQEYVLECIRNKTGKWVRYDNNGKMLKGWVTISGDLAVLYPEQAGNTYYYDYKTGLMAKGEVTIQGAKCVFDTISGKLISKTIEPPSDFFNGYEFGEFDKYNSPASENGHDGDLIWISGKLNSVFESETGAYWGIVKNDDDKQWLIILDWIFNDREKYDDLIDKDIYVIGSYMGYSSVLNMPAMTMCEIWDRNEGKSIKSILYSYL